MLTSLITIAFYRYKILKHEKAFISAGSWFVFMVFIAFFLFYFPLFPFKWSRISLFYLVPSHCLKAEQAARESRNTKQDRYAEMRRRKDEEREAQEHQLVCWFSALCWIIKMRIRVCGWITGWRYDYCFIGGRSQGSEGEGGGSCCLRVWEVERRVFYRCWRYYRKWSAGWTSGFALWFCGIHKGSFQFCPVTFIQRYCSLLL